MKSASGSILSRIKSQRSWAALPDIRKQAAPRVRSHFGQLVQLVNLESDAARAQDKRFGGLDPFDARGRPQPNSSTGRYTLHKGRTYERSRPDRNASAVSEHHSKLRGRLEGTGNAKIGGRGRNFQLRLKPWE